LWFFDAMRPGRLSCPVLLESDDFEPGFLAAAGGLIRGGEGVAAWLELDARIFRVMIDRYRSA
jgi:hypothetical protein